MPIASAKCCTNWFNLYDWEGDETGIESETELDFAVTRHFSLELRHRYRDSGATLQSESLNQLRLFTRLRF